VEEGGGESGGDAKSAEACWKRVFEVGEEVGTVESQVRADGRSIVRVGSCCREVKCGCGEVESRTVMRRCDGEAQLISAQRNNTWVSQRLIDVLLLSRRMDRSGVYASATPLRSCMRACGGLGCRSCCASMEEEERPSNGGRAGQLIGAVLMLRHPCSQRGLVMGRWASCSDQAGTTATHRQHPHRRTTEMDLVHDTIHRLDCCEGF
jgi:hypothetical protein